MNDSVIKAETGEEIDEAFERGKDMRSYFDFSQAVAVYPDSEKKNVNITLPAWLVKELDIEADRRGTSRRAVINDWLVDRADREREQRVSALC